MAISFADIETLMDAATAAVESSNYDLAINKATQAQGKLSLIASGRQKGNIETETIWNHSAINDFIKNVESLRVRSIGSSGPFAMFQTKFSTRSNS